MRPTSVSPILRTMSKNLGLEKGLAFYQLKAAWPDLVGQPIAAHTVPDKIRFSSLTLLVDGAAWMHELTFFKEEMLEKINQKLGRKSGQNPIRSLHLKLGQVPKKTSPATSDAARRTKSLSSEEASLIRQSLKSISDEGLKRVIEKAMVQHLQKRGSLATRNQSFE